MRRPSQLRRSDRCRSARWRSYNRCCTRLGLSEPQPGSTFSGVNEPLCQKNPSSPAVGCGENGRVEKSASPTTSPLEFISDTSWTQFTLVEVSGTSVYAAAAPGAASTTVMQPTRRASTEVTHPTKARGPAEAPPTAPTAGRRPPFARIISVTASASSQISGGWRGRRRSWYVSRDVQGEADQ